MINLFNNPIQTLDICNKIPIVSSLTNLYHIFNKLVWQTNHDSAYTNFQTRFSLYENALLIIPFYNVFVSFDNDHYYKQALDLVRQDGNNLRSLPTHLQNDFLIVLTAVKNYGGALEFASEALKDNREIVEAAIFQDPEVLVLASDRLKTDMSLTKIMCSLVFKRVKD